MRCIADRDVFARGRVVRLASVVVVLAASATTVAGQLAPLTYAPGQAVAGESVYLAYCASCHGERLSDGRAESLAGPEFQLRWASARVSDLFVRTRTTMPPPAPGSLSDEEYASVLAYIFRENGFLSGAEPLPASAAAMASMLMPAGGSGRPGPAEPNVVFPPPPTPTPSPLEGLTAVSEAALRDPPPEDWLTWRRTPTADGYSPLEEVDRSNVHRLQLVWSWALPNGANESTPLVHDGVLFVYGYGDVVQALDAKTGDPLWEYARDLPQGTTPAFKKSIALYGDNVYTATADGHMVALDARTGEAVWDIPVAGGRGAITGGPLAANGKIIVGTNRTPRESPNPNPAAGRDRGRGLVVALDAETGEELWRFDTVPGPGEPGGETWNDLPLHRRSGGSVWVPGSYDPELNLVFFGPSPTYDTAPVRVAVRADDPSVNSALYTNTTIALDADTGELVWHYQHLANDQWDLDWAFERQVMMLPVDGEMRRVVVTAGKASIHEVLDARTGEYLFSMDLGLQNFITGIDPETGAKTIDRGRVPGDGEVKFVCPHVEGGKNWIPSAVNPGTSVLFVPIVESCMYMMPTVGGRSGLLTTAGRIILSPRPDTDGRYGRLQAINLATRETVWVERQRAPYMTGILATAGGLVFAGSMDRVFAAYDQTNGERLWSTRLTEVPNSAPITYSVDGRQYVAVVVGSGGYHSRGFRRLVPEIAYPANRSSAISVFALPE